MSKKIKDPQSHPGKFALSRNSETSSSQFPVFCLRFLHKDFCLTQCDKDEKVKFIERLVTLSSLTWNELQLAPKHGLGCEKINRNSVTIGIPSDVTEDVQSFLSFRFMGKKPFIGYRTGLILHIIYIDRNFCVYKH